MSTNESPFQNITDRRHFIIDCYIEMLSRINEHEIIPLINSNPQDFSVIDEDNPFIIDKAIQSLSIYFQLMTLSEENEIGRASCRERV